MLAAVWRVKGNPFDVDDFLNSHPLDVDLVWRIGEARSKGKVFDTSGFSISLDSVDIHDSEPSWEYVMDDIRRFFIDNKSIIQALHVYNLDQTIDVGFTVGYKPFTRSLRFPQDILVMLSDHHIDLIVSAYPFGNPMIN